MKKQGNWYKMWSMLAIALIAEQDLEPKVAPKKVGDKDYWPKYAALPKGCEIFKHRIKFVDENKETKFIILNVMASSEKKAKVKFDKLILELKGWDGSQKELGSIIRKHNNYCAPLKINSYE